MRELTRLIRIENPQECRIIERLNRFVVLIELEGTYHRAHITNTGRLTEFMVKGQQAFCFRTYHQGKTDFRLFAIADRGFGALIDTWLQMNAFEEALKRNSIPWLDGCRMRKRNALLGESRSQSQSRIDYLLDCHGKEAYLEVKSAVLRDREYATYPDCPSERGRKHIRELSRYVKAGGTGILVFMAALPYITAFTPNRAADAEFSEAFMAAHASGVDIRAIALYYNPRDAFVYLVNPDLPIVHIS